MQTPHMTTIIKYIFVVILKVIVCSVLIYSLSLVYTNILCRNVIPNQFKLDRLGDHTKNYRFASYSSAFQSINIYLISPSRANEVVNKYHRDVIERISVSKGGVINEQEKVNVIFFESGFPLKLLNACFVDGRPTNGSFTLNSGKIGISWKKDKYSLSVRWNDCWIYGFNLYRTLVSGVIFFALCTSVSASYKYIKYRYRILRNMCLNCGYSLNGVAISACPECGRMGAKKPIGEQKTVMRPSDTDCPHLRSSPPQ